MSIEQSFNQLKEILKMGKLSGAWLITGPEGVGKKTLLKRFCGLLLKGEDTPIDFHQDLKWIQCDYTEKDKKEILKTLKEGRLVTEEMEKSFKRKNEITIDDIRSGMTFLSLTSSGKKWRVLVIDSADEMNENAANALLKVLEEPPAQSVLFLISNNKGKLLPTIKSRCRELPVAPVSKEEIKRYIESHYPKAHDIEALCEFSEGSIGKIKSIFENNLYPVYLEMEELLTTRKGDTAAIYALCERFSEEDSSVLKDFLSFYLVQKAKESPEKYLDLWEEVSLSFREMETLYLDKRNTFASIFFKIGALQ